MLPWDCCLCVSKTLINKSLENIKKIDSCRQKKLIFDRKDRYDAE
jgi:hypothetical protein